MPMAYSGGRDSGRPAVDATTCTVCGACAEVCASGALAKYGIPRGHTPRIALILGFPAVRCRRAIRRSFAGVRWY